jgi:hypothetical protein
MHLAYADTATFPAVGDAISQGGIEHHGALDAHMDVGSAPSNGTEVPLFGGHEAHRSTVYPPLQGDPHSSVIIRAVPAISMVCPR